MYGHAMGLFVGTEWACIVDTSWGATGNLCECVAQITDLSVLCMRTNPTPTMRALPFCLMKST